MKKHNLRRQEREELGSRVSLDALLLPSNFLQATKKPDEFPKEHEIFAACQPR